MHINRKRAPVGGALAAAIVAGIVAIALTGPASAQVDAGGRQLREIDRQQRFSELQQLEIDNRLRANSDVPAGQRALIDWGGYITLNYFSIDDRNNNNHTLRQPDFVLYGRANLDAANEVFARARISYQDFSPGDSFNNRGNRWTEVEFERVYYRFDLGKYEAAYHGKQLPYNVSFQVGRDLVYWANGLSMGQVIDGGIADLTWKQLTLELIAGITPVRTVDIDTSRPDFDINTRRGFYGAMLTWSPDTPGFGRHHPFIYGLVQRDYNSRDLLVQGNIRTNYDYNSYYIGAGSNGSLGDHLVYGAEVAFEGGNTLSNSFRVNGFSLEQVPQTRDDIQACAADFRLDYLFTDVRNTRLSAEAILASGDPHRQNSSNTFGGARPGGKDFSFNGFGLINTGLAFAPEVSNLEAFRIGASTFPLGDSIRFRRLQVGADFFVFNKLQRHGAFDEGTNNRYHLGVEPDVYLNWQITSDVTLAVRYGIFFPTSTLLSNADNRQFVYTGVTFAF